MEPRAYDLMHSGMEWAAGGKLRGGQGGLQMAGDKVIFGRGKHKIGCQ